MCPGRYQRLHRTVKLTIGGTDRCTNHQFEKLILRVAGSPGGREIAIADLRRMPHHLFNQSAQPLGENGVLEGSAAQVWRRAPLPVENAL